MRIIIRINKESRQHYNYNYNQNYNTSQNGTTITGEAEMKNNNSLYEISLKSRNSDSTEFVGYNHHKVIESNININDEQTNVNVNVNLANSNSNVKLEKLDKLELMSSCGTNKSISLPGGIILKFVNKRDSLDRQRVASVLKSMFFDESIQFALGSEISRLVDWGIKEQEVMSTEFFVQNLTQHHFSWHPRFKLKLDVVTEMHKYMEKFMLKPHYTDRELMSHFKNKIVVCKNYGNVNQTYDVMAYADNLDKVLTEMDKIKQLYNDLKQTCPEMRENVLF